MDNKCFEEFKQEISKLVSGQFYDDVINISVDVNNNDLPNNDELLEVTDKLIEQFDLSEDLDDEQYEELTEFVQDIWSNKNNEL